MKKIIRILLASLLLINSFQSKAIGEQNSNSTGGKVDFAGLDKLFEEQRRKDLKQRKKVADFANKKQKQAEKSKTEADAKAEAQKQESKDKILKNEELYITGVREKSESFSYNILNKDSKSLDKQMVTDIRDLTKYDPGISINETSQGTSSGFSMRGVDRNRVSISVDGLSQAQAFSPSGNFQAEGAFGGAINEMEVENVKAVTIQKGASSVVAGNGSLGGSVLYVTKEAFDIIKPGKKYGLNLKSGYTSKDLRYFTSLGMAGLIGNMDLLFIHTYRKGREFQPYSWQAKPQTLDFYYDSSTDVQGTSIVTKNKEQRTKNKEQRTKNKYYNTPTNSSKNNLHSITLDPYNVWGATRELPNPMFYQSKSTLLKAGLEISPEHYVTGTFEHSKQDFDLTDMQNSIFPYWDKYKDPNGSKLSSGVLKDINSHGAGVHRWMHIKFRQNIHTKLRYGIKYNYSPIELSAASPDNLNLSFDVQDISMDNIEDLRHCSKKITKDCWPKSDGQYAWHNVTGTREKRLKLEAKMDKNFELYTTVQDIKISVGMEYGTYDHKQKGYGESVHMIYSTNNPSIFKIKNPGMGHHNSSLESINTHHFFASFNDSMKIGQSFEFLLGLRADFYDFTSLNKYSRNARYQNVSWHTGLVYKPMDYLEIGYIASSGFNMPSIQQIYDISITFPGTLAQSAVDKGYVAARLNPEQAINHELGVTFDYRLGMIKASIFVADYKGLIAPYLEKDKDGNVVGALTYKNVQDAYTVGFDLNVNLNWHEITRYMPEGLSTRFSFSLVRPRKFPKVIDKSSTNFIETSYVMDTLQPAKLVFGVSYDAPSGIWGLDSNLVHSASKNSDELKQLKISPIAGTLALSPFLESSKSWTTLDISAWVNVFGTANLRLGVYNLFNTKYITWESLRQTGIAGVSTTLKPKIAYQGINRLNAAGINFSLVLEVKL